MQSINFENSSNLQRASYDPERKRLRVTFRKGGSYEYAEVPPLVFEELSKAESAGKFFAAEIRDVYQGEKLP